MEVQGSQGSWIDRELQAMDDELRQSGSSGAASQLTKDEVITILRESSTEQATRSQIRAALKHDANRIDDDMLNKILEDMQADDTVKLDEHGDVHLLLGGDGRGISGGLLPLARKLPDL